MAYFIVFFHLIVIALVCFIGWDMTKNLDDAMNTRIFLLMFVLVAIGFTSLMMFLGGSSWSGL